MRVTQLMVNRNFNQTLQRNNEAVEKIRQQISSGVKFEKISDNPMAAMKALSYTSSMTRLEQYQKNTQDGIDWLTAADDALENATDVMQRIQELTVQGSNDTSDSVDRKSIAAEISTLKEQLGTIANTTFNGRYLFSGTSNTPAFDGGSLQTGVQTPMSWDVGQGLSMSVNVNAQSIFGQSVDGKNLFETLDSLVRTLDSGENPSNLLSAFDKQMDNVLLQRTIVGANQNQLELAVNKLDQNFALNQKMLTKTAATDLPKAYTELSAQQSVLNASLAAGAKIIQPTLVDFLR